MAPARPDWCVARVSGWRGSVTTPTTITVVGGGVLGLCVALRARQAGAQVTLVSREGGASAHAGGMLAPLCELDHAEPDIAAAGLDSVARWQALLDELDISAEGLLEARGSVVVAHRPEWGLLDQLWDRIERAELSHRATRVRRDGLDTAEPVLAERFSRALLTEGEGAVHPLPMLAALDAACTTRGVTRIHGEVTQVAPGAIVVEGTAHNADLIIDTRGLGARTALPLRGVRGEYITLRCPGLPIGRPVRLAHPRYPIYVVPRPHETFYIGATQVERDDNMPMTARGALELLSALVSVHPAFAEAEILSMGVAARPALPHHLPELRHQPGLIQANGLFRHGWMLAPLISAATVALATGQPLPPLPASMTPVGTQERGYTG